MKTQSIFALLLIVVGIIILVYQGVSFVSRENVIDLGPLQVTAERTRTLPVSPVIGAASLFGGIVLLFTGRKRR